MSKKTIGMLFKIPALLVLIASFLAGIYAAYYKIQNMGWEVPIILGVVLVLYGIGARIEGSYYKNKEKKPKPKVKEEEIGFEEESEF